MGEAYYRESEFDKAIAEFRTFLSFYPRHQIADLVQYRLARAGALRQASRVFVWSQLGWLLLLLAEHGALG